MAHNTTAPTSASTSSSPASNYFHIFINHHGRDVKKTMAAHLYRALTSHGLQVFLDRPELQGGKRIISQIKEAIQVASAHIAIFSENYAKSNWCLDELRLMVDSQQRGATILPVFYNIKPSDVRWVDAAQNGPYATALLEHEKKGRYDTQKIQGWREALSEVSYISGFELEACNGDEADLLDKVVKTVLTKVPKPALHVAKYATGLREKIEDFEKTVSCQQEQQPRESKVVAIAGVGGVGKTTLAKEFFNSKRLGYGGSSFLADVREKASRASLPSLQSQLIKDLKGIDKGIDKWEEGIGILETCLSSCHALIIIDDVDDADQLDAFLPIKGVLHPKSLILVTSRDKHVLRSAGIGKSSIYQLKGLNESHSQELFCSHAFFQPHPRVGFEKLVVGFVKSCDGLPLSLKVFGALLCEKERPYWEEKLKEVHRLPDKILASLKISYNSLNHKEQQIFLDIACFAIGEERDKWVTIWGGLAGLQTLEDRCLVEEYGAKRMRMHDHLRDMGRNIAEEVSRGGGPRRLWRSVEDVHDLFEEQSLSLSSVIPHVRGIRMRTRWPYQTTTEEEALLRTKSEILLNEISSEPAIKMSTLQLLESEGEFVEGILRRVRSPNLVWLRWDNCPCSSLPNWIPMGHLKVLEVRGTKLKKLWRRDSQAPLKLRELYVDAPLLEFPKSIGKLKDLEKIVLQNISYSNRPPEPADLSTLPEEFFHLRSLKYLELHGQFRILPKELGNLTNLQRIVLYGCKRLEKLPDSFTGLTNLQVLNLSPCNNLKRLPKSLGDLTNLREITLGECQSLEVLPYSFTNLTNLQKVHLSGCNRLKRLPNSLGDLTNLQEITFQNCGGLEVLPDSFGSLKSLLRIQLTGCKILKKLPDSFTDLKSLQYLKLSGSDTLKRLPKSLGDLTNLQHIDISGFASLKKLPNSLGDLTNLQGITLEDCKGLEVLPESFGCLTNLLRIELTGCKRFKKLPDSFTDLKSLQHLNLSGSDKLKRLPKSLGDLTNLQHIDISGFASLKKLPNSLGDLTNLQTITLSDCQGLEVLPDSFGSLKSLLRIELTGCKRWKKLPDSFTDLKSLQHLKLSGSDTLKRLPKSWGDLTNLQHIHLSGFASLKKLPNSLGDLTNLQTITLRGCEGLEVLPDSFGSLKSLLRIELTGCKRLKKLPDSFTDLKSLQHLNLSGSDTLKRLPKSLGCVTNLQHINLSNCKSLKKLPNSLGDLKKLQEINLDKCESLEALPDSFGNLKNLQRIYLCDCGGLKTLSNSFRHLKNLESIHLTACKSLKMLPDNFFGNLINLQTVNLSGFESLAKLPHSLGNLTKLRSIKLDNCKSLKKLPKSLGELTNLRSIDLSGCKSLKKLPNSLGNLSQLRCLDLSHCSTCSLELPGNITTLEFLDLSGCVQMEALPAQVEHQKSLKVLNLVGTHLKELPNAQTACLSNLRYLFLGSPLLKELPPSFGCLFSNLQELLIHGCQEMKRLPDSFGLLTQLTRLEISKCGIQELPGDLMEMNNLRTLRVRDCPLRELPFKESSAPRRKRKRRATDKGLIELRELELYCTEVREVSFPEGVCTNLIWLSIMCCNDLVKVGSLPETIRYLTLRGCGALGKIEGLSGLAKTLEKVDMRGCCNIEMGEVPHFGNSTLLFIPTDTYNRQEEEEEEEEEGVLPNLFAWRVTNMKTSALYSSL